jgi:lysophospholipid acyltransferase (LPLAT)-like uncharacterized protein
VSSDSPLTASQLFQAKAIAAVASPIVGALCRTLTWSAEGGHYFDDVVRAGRQPIMAFWHGRILGGLDYFRHRHIVVITSQNFDGEWIGGIIARFGFGVARGSTSRGAARALVQLRRDLTAGRPVAFTVDGPRGPARVAQPGAVWLAGATGNPILPFHVEADRFWSMRSWDRTQIPKPFAHAAIAIGAPFEVAGTSDETIETRRRDLESELASLEARAHALLKQPYPSVARPDGSRVAGNDVTK